MRTEFVVIVDGALFWIACGIAVHGFIFAFMQSEFPLKAANNYHQDKWFSRILALGGPIALMEVFRMGGCRHGMKFK